jgi:glyoxylase-like metal-dependent hydrolase (beta-lactamase superfamily II)
MLQTDVAKGVHRIEDSYTNWYLVEEGGRFTVVDCGVRSSWTSFQNALRELDASPGDIDAIILTHAHFDHTGFAEKARRELQVPVWVHENDVPLTKKPLQYAHERSRLPYLFKPRALPIAASFIRTRAFIPTPIKKVERFTGGTLQVPGSPEVVFTPGHTVGHVAFHLPDRDVLFSGDAIVTLNPYTGSVGPQMVARAATADSARNIESFDDIEATGASIVLTGHGEPWRDGVADMVKRARAAGVS